MKIETRATRQVRQTDRSIGQQRRGTDGRTTIDVTCPRNDSNFQISRLEVFVWRIPNLAQPRENGQASSSSFRWSHRAPIWNRRVSRRSPDTEGWQGVF